MAIPKSYLGVLELPSVVRKNLRHKLEYEISAV
jgi:hypothetical protein